MPGQEIVERRIDTLSFHVWCRVENDHLDASFGQLYGYRETSEPTTNYNGVSEGTGFSHLCYS